MILGKKEYLGGERKELIKQQLVKMVRLNPIPEKKKDLERFYRTLSNEDRDAFWERMSKIDVEERQNAATEE